MKYSTLICLLLFNVSVVLSAPHAVGEASDPSPAPALDDVAKVVETKGIFGEGLVYTSPEFKAARAQGVTLMPELVRRLAATDNVLLVETYTTLFYMITGIAPFAYTTESYVVKGVDLYEADTTNLPFLKTRLVGGGEDPLQVRDLYLAWWEKVQKDNLFAERTSAMRTLTGKLSADGTDMSASDYRAFRRANINYGIFNLPVYIALIRKDNNPLAFMEFLSVTVLPDYTRLDLPAHAEERLKVVGKNWPSKEERVALVDKWWAENKAKYETALPSLAQAIAQAMGE